MIGQSNNDNDLKQVKGELKYMINLKKLESEKEKEWGLGIGDWAQSPIPNPQSPIPNPQSPKFLF